MTDNRSNHAEEGEEDMYYNVGSQHAQVAPSTNSVYSNHDSYLEPEGSTSPQGQYYSEPKEPEGSTSPHGQYYSEPKEPEGSTSPQGQYYSEPKEPEGRTRQHGQYYSEPKEPDGTNDVKPDDDPNDYVDIENESRDINHVIYDPTYNTIGEPDEETRHSQDSAVREGQGGDNYYYLENPVNKTKENPYDTSGKSYPHLYRHTGNTSSRNRKSRVSQYVSRRVTQMWADRKKKVCGCCTRCFLCVGLLLLILAAIGLIITMFFTVICKYILYFNY